MYHRLLLQQPYPGERKYMKKNKDDIINGWIEKADRDLEVAERELKISDH
jgi:hypothetical protein